MIPWKYRYIATFLSERTNDEHPHFVSMADLYDAYVSWSSENKCYVQSKRTLGRFVRERGHPVEKHGSKGTTIVIGMTLKKAEGSLDPTTPSTITHT